MTNQTLRMHNEPKSNFNVENIGLIDRLLRVGVAVVLIGQMLLWREAPETQSYLVLLGLYPAFTAIMGWDPLYALMDARTCGGSPRSVCGTFTDQARAAARGWHRGVMAGVLPFRGPRSAVIAEAANDSGQRDRAA